MEIYADVIFAVNLAMDFLVLWICSRLLGLRTRIYRLILGAASGAGLCVFFLYMGLGAAGNVLTLETVYLACVYISFSPRSIKAAAAALLTTHLVSFGLGGICLALFMFFGGGTGLGVVFPDLGAFSVWVLAAASALSYALLKLFGPLFKRKVLNRPEMYETKVYADGREVTLTSMLDTGNLLCEPVSGEPVLIAEYARIRPVLPAGAETGLYGPDGEANLDALLTKGGGFFRNRLRLLPYESLGKKNGLLIGFRADKVEFKPLAAESGPKTERKNVIVGLYNSSLSDDGLYDALLNAELI